MSDVEDRPRPLLFGEQRTPLVEPLRGLPPVHCRWCGGEIEAHAAVSVHGLSAGHDWRHVASGKVRCEPNPPWAQPYDGFEAERQLLRAREAS